MPGGMELDLVDALAAAVVRAQRRRMLVRLESPDDRLPPARDLAERPHPLLRPPRAFAPQRLDERRVRRKKVYILERRRLVEGVRHEAKDISPPALTLSVRGHG